MSNRPESGPERRAACHEGWGERKTSSGVLCGGQVPVSAPRREAAIAQARAPEDAQLSKAVSGLSVARSASSRWCGQLGVTGTCRDYALP